MAVFSQASDINTRERIWVAHNLDSKRGRQLNSHTSDCYNREQIDGFPAWEFAGLYTDYTGNDWQSKYMAFIEKWSECTETGKEEDTFWGAKVTEEELDELDKWMDEKYPEV